MKNIQKALQILSTAALSINTYAAPLNMDQSKITPLIGKWSINGDPLNLSFEINKIDYNDVAGYFGRGANITCMDATFFNNTQILVGNKIPIYDYTCTINDTLYLLSIKSNVIDGQYCRSPQCTTIGKGIKVTGAKIVEPPPVLNTDPTFDSASGKLILQNVKVGSDTYSATLIYEGNNIFRLETVNKK